MADNNRGGGAPFLAFLVGGLVIAFAVYGGFAPVSRDMDVKVQMPAAPSLPSAPTLPNPQPMPAPIPTPVPR